MEHADTAQIAAVVAALGSALVLLARGRALLIGGLVLLAGAEAALGLSLGGGPQLDDLVSPAGAAAGVAGATVLGGLAALLVRWPGVVPAALLAAAPFRPPFEYDPGSALLIGVAEDGQLGRLLPLYLVLGAAGVALAWRALRVRELQRIPPVLALPAAAFFTFASLSLLWARDVEAGANLLTFFTLPFAALVAIIARSPFPDWLPRALGRIAIGLGALFAAIGLWQAATHELFFFAPNLELANANSDYFRVTSLFGDPSLYGRHVVLGLGVVLVALALGRVAVSLGLGLLALLWAGLLFSYSQSSMTALVVVTLAIAAVTGDRRVRRAVGVVAAVAALAGCAYVGVKLVGGDSLNQLTQDRTQRVEDTLRVMEDRPLVGVGVGGQPRASRAAAGSDRPSANFVSHTTPLTVAAELGAIGLALYVWLLVGGARLIDAVRRREEALGLALGAAFLALFVHALFYSGFLEDPITWVVLGVGAAYLGRWQESLPARERAAARERERAAAGGAGA